MNKILKLILFEKNIKSIFLDYPFNYRNLIFLIVITIRNLLKKETIEPFLSSRGNLAFENTKNQNMKFIYWQILSILLILSGGKIITSSGYERKLINKLLIFNKRIKIISITDYQFMNDYFREVIKISKNKRLDKIINNKISSHNFKKQNLKILCPSRFSHEKGVFQLLDLIVNTNNLNNRAYSKNEIQIDFCFDEKKIDSEKYQKLISNDICKVNFLGYLKGKFFMETMSGYDVVVIPSQWESFAIAAFEALLCHCGLIITSNSPWEFISKFDNKLPIHICNPLLRGTSLITFLDECYDLKLKIKNKINVDSLIENIIFENEANI